LNSRQGLPRHSVMRKDMGFWLVLSSWTRPATRLSSTVLGTRRVRNPIKVCCNSQSHRLELDSITNLPSFTTAFCGQCFDKNLLSLSLHLDYSFQQRARSFTGVVRCLIFRQCLTRDFGLKFFTRRVSLNNLFFIAQGSHQALLPKLAFPNKGWLDCDIVLDALMVVTDV
jgi:hypothetical protein